MAESLKSKTVAGVLWSAVERFSLQGVQFIINIIMARLLLPSDYGMIGMLAVFLQMSQTFIDSGFSDALIQKKNRTNQDLSTVFYFNIVLSFVFYLLIFFSAPYIADFYHARANRMLKDTRNHFGDMMNTALNYMINGWRDLLNYRHDGRYDIDNTEAERKIRPLTIGRKNTLFFGSEEGVEVATTYYTFIETCKLNGFSVGLSNASFPPTYDGK